MTRNLRRRLETRRRIGEYALLDHNRKRLVVLYRSLPPMCLYRSLTSGLIGLTLCVAAARAEGPPSPLHLLPKQTDLLVEVKQPRRLVETLTTLEMLKQIRQFAPVRELLDSTP